jgi:hypothetical protein
MDFLSTNIKKKPFFCSNVNVSSATKITQTGGREIHEYFILLRFLMSALIPYTCGYEKKFMGT